MSPHRLTPLAVLSILLVLAGAGALGRWWTGLIPAGWSLGATGRVCRLDRVLDGDSLRLVCAGEPVEVRLHCIDAPEKDQRPWGDRARTGLRGLVTDRLELVPLEVDRFGRTVGEVYTTGPERRFLNLEQVRRGHAAVYDRYCEDPRFPEAEREARRARVGIWSQKGEQQTPWTFRHRQSRR